MFTPDADQEAAIERMVNEPTKAALNASLFGTGKTLVTVEVAKRLGTKQNLIACPLFTKYSWESMIRRQVPDADIYHLNSTKAGKEAMQKLLAGEPGWYIVGREYMLTKNAYELLQPYAKNIDFFAFDECASWANRLSQGFKKMKKFHPKFKIALSATPYGNKFQNMFSIAKWLWPTEIPNSFWAWAGKWCKIEKDYFAGDVIVGELNQGAFVNSLPCYIRIEKDFGEVHESTLEVKLSPSERRIYDTLEKAMVVKLAEDYLVIKIPATLRIRLRQMSLGEVALDEDGSLYFKDDMKSTKYDTLLELIRENPEEPMLVLTDSRRYAEAATNKLIKDGYRAAAWHGKVSETQRHKIKAAFEAGELDYIVATIPSIGEGVDGLQHRSRIMIWMSKSDNNQLNMQAYRRLYRRGQTRQVISIDISALDTYDSGQLSKLMQKQLDTNATLKKEKQT